MGDDGVQGKECKAEPILAVAALLQEDELRRQHAAEMRVIDQQYTTLYDSLVSFSRSMGLGPESLLTFEDEDTQRSRCDSNLLFRLRCEEESSQLEAQRSFLLESLERKRLECEKLCAEGHALRSEIEHLFQPVQALTGGTSLDIPSDGETLLVQRLLRAPSTTKEETPIVALAAAAAALEEQIRVMEKAVLKKGKHTLAVNEVHQWTLQALTEDVSDTKQGFVRDVESLAVVEVMALCAEEKSERLLLELEEMMQAEQRDECFAQQLVKLHEVFNRNMKSLQQRSEALRRLLLVDGQTAQPVNTTLITNSQPPDAHNDVEIFDTEIDAEEKKKRMLALQASA